MGIRHHLSSASFTRRNPPHYLWLPWFPLPLTRTTLGIGFESALRCAYIFFWAAAIVTFRESNANFAIPYIVPFFAIFMSSQTLGMMLMGAVGSIKGGLISAFVVWITQEAGLNSGDQTACALLIFFMTCFFSYLFREPQNAGVLKITVVFYSIATLTIINAPPNFFGHNLGWKLLEETMWAFGICFGAFLFPIPIRFARHEAEDRFFFAMQQTKAIYVGVYRILNQTQEKIRHLATCTAKSKLSVSLFASLNIELQTVKLEYEELQQNIVAIRQKLLESTLEPVFITEMFYYGCRKQKGEILVIHVDEHLKVLDHFAWLLGNLLQTLELIHRINEQHQDKPANPALPQKGGADALSHTLFFQLISQLKSIFEAMSPQLDEFFLLYGEHWTDAERVQDLQRQLRDRKDQLFSAFEQVRIEGFGISTDNHATTLNIMSEKGESVNPPIASKDHGISLSLSPSAAQPQAPGSVVFHLGETSEILPNAVFSPSSKASQVSVGLSTAISTPPSFISDSTHQFHSYELFFYIHRFLAVLTSTDLSRMHHAPRMPWLLLVYSTALAPNLGQQPWLKTAGWTLPFRLFSFAFKRVLWEIPLAEIAALPKSIPAMQDAVKLAFIVTVAALLEIIPESAQALDHGAWTVVTVIFCFSENVGAALVQCGLRLFGTFLGATYGFLIIRGFGQGNDLNILDPLAAAIDTHNRYLGILFLCLWVFVLGFARFHPQYGYAATVASFTSAIIYFGYSPTADDTAGDFALARVQETVIGILCYLVINAVLWPVAASSKILGEMTTTLKIIADLVDSTSNNYVKSSKKIFSTVAKAAAVAKTASANATEDAIEMKELGNTLRRAESLGQTVTQISAQISSQQSTLNLVLRSSFDRQARYLFQADHEPHFLQKSFPSELFAALLAELKSLWLSTFALLDSTLMTHEYFHNQSQEMAEYIHDRQKLPHVVELREKFEDLFLRAGAEIKKFIHLVVAFLSFYEKDWQHETLNTLTRKRPSRLAIFLFEEDEEEKEELKEKAKEKSDEQKETGQDSNRTKERMKNKNANSSDDHGNEPFHWAELWSNFKCGAAEFSDFSLFDWLAFIHFALTEVEWQHHQLMDTHQAWMHAITLAIVDRKLQVGSTAVILSTMTIFQTIKCFHRKVQKVGKIVEAIQVYQSEALSPYAN